MSEQADTRIAIWPAIQRFLTLSHRHRSWLYLAMGIAVLETGCNIVSTFTLGRFLDAVTAHEYGRFLSYLAITVALQFLYAPLGYWRSASVGRFSERAMADLRHRVAACFATLPAAEMDARHSGDLLAIVNADLSRLQQLAGNSLLSVVSQSVLGLGALVALFIISWQLALVSTLLVPVMFLIMSKLSQPVASRAQRIQEALGDTIAVAQDGLGGLMVTRTFNLAGIMDTRFGRANRQVLSRGLSLTRFQALADGSGAVFAFMPFLLAMGYGGYLTITGHLTFGSLFAFIIIMNYVANPLGSLPPLISSISEAGGAVQRTYELFDLPAERAAGRDYARQALAPAAPVVSLDHVAFGYGDELVLKDVSLAVSPGETVALVGSSGSGKSTLLKLILGAYPVSSGRLDLLGHDLHDWALPAARAQMAFVAQDTFLFPVTIRENIACGRPGATPAEIEAAARMANIHDHIVSLPGSYDTQVGERGVRLSGGQRQRLALARAILRDAPLLLLDEPTSALDTESEALVQEALERFMAGRTTIVVAHRLSTIRHADRVLVLEGGRVVEEGTHEELMTTGGRYRELYLRQFDEPVDTTGEEVRP